MGLKADASFLRFVSMGAIGSLAVIENLREAGFNIIELERYSTSNKIWSTKVKRLRLPDLLCVRTGVRFEARGKSDLAIKMSHSPKNMERAWDGGLRDQDVVAFVKIWPEKWMTGVPAYFDVGALRASRETAKQGKPKSASEGAEVDLEWPSWCPKQGGRVVEVTPTQIRIVKDDDKPYTYSLQGKHAYVDVGDTFGAEECILAGTAPRKADLVAKSKQTWDAIESLSVANPMDRFASAKAIPHLDLRKRGVDALLERLVEEAEARVKLEVAASLAKLNIDVGFEELFLAVVQPAEPYLRMEAVLIATEVGGAKARDLLMTVATSPDYSGQEVRQAAVWGLGESGCASYVDLVPFLADADDDVAIHAICAFTAPLPPDVGANLVRLALHGGPRAQAGAREVLHRCAGPNEIHALAVASEEAALGVETAALASLAMFTRERLADAAVGNDVIARLAPIRLLLDPRENWLAAKEYVDSIAFLASQTVHARQDER